MLLRIATAILLVTCAGGLAVGEEPLREAQHVRNLTPEQAAERRPVKLAGIVTHVNPHVGDFFVQDSSAGIYVHPSDHAAALKQGDLVEVEGTTDAGDFAPCVTPAAVRVAGKGKLPDPVPFSLAQDESRWLDGQWVQVSVLVRSAVVANGFTEVEVYSATGTATLRLPDEKAVKVFERMKGRAVPIRGVCVPRFEDRVVVGPPRIYTQSVPMLPLTIGPGRKAAEPPLRMIDHLLSFSPSPFAGHRWVKVSGVVTANPYPGVVFVQDETGGATVQTEAAGAVPLNSRVEAEGLIHIEGRRITLTRATLKVLGPAAPPAPRNATAESLFGECCNAALVRVEGKVEDTRTAGGWTEIALADRTRRFGVYVPGTVDVGPPGTRVSVVGVATVLHPDGKAHTDSGVVARTPADVTVLEPPPAAPAAAYWTAGRVWGVFGGLLLVCVLAGVWVVTLRHQVRRAAAQIEKQYDDRGRLETQLKQAAKLEAVGRLAGGIAHDFNNLLTVINGCSELLSELIPTDRPKAGALLSDIRTAGAKAAALTGQLLMFSRKKDVPLSAVNLNEVASETARLLRRVIGENILVETRLGDDLPAVRAEPGLLHQVIMNLAVNAKDAMPDGGTLTIQTGIALGTEIEGASDTRTYVRLTVSDTGCGMDDQTQARVFEPFFTTKDVGKGTGLGLATVYGIVQTLRGKVRITSAVGKGSTFHIDLRPHDETPSDPALRANAPPIRLDGVTVLLVEDNDMVREMLVQGLMDDGATVIPAARADAALRRLDAGFGRVDLLVTDVMMPGMNGRELAERVRARRPDIKVVYMSGYAGDEVARHGVLADPVSFLQKPFTPDQLTARLRQILGPLEPAVDTSVPQITTI